MWTTFVKLTGGTRHPRHANRVCLKWKLLLIPHLEFAMLLECMLLNEVPMCQICFNYIKFGLRKHLDGISEIEIHGFEIRYI